MVALTPSSDSEFVTNEFHEQSGVYVSGLKARPATEAVQLVVDEPHAATMKPCPAVAPWAVSHAPVPITGTLSVAVTDPESMQSPLQVNGGIVQCTVSSWLGGW